MLSYFQAHGISQAQAILPHLFHLMKNSSFTRISPKVPLFWDPLPLSTFSRILIDGLLWSSSLSTRILLYYNTHSFIQ